jgi:hypothetical protein
MRMSSDHGLIKRVLLRWLTEKKKLGRPYKWHANATTGIVLTPPNVTQYVINKAIDANNPKAHTQKKLLDKITAQLGLHCNYNEDNLLEELNSAGVPSEVKDLKTMVGEARAKEITRRMTFLKDARQVRGPPLSYEQ